MLEPIRGASGMLVFAAALSTAACAELPAGVNGALPPARDGSSLPVYRDLADIPPPPPVSSAEENQAVMQSLARDRGRVAEAVEDLRRQPFAVPEPAPMSGS